MLRPAHSLLAVAITLVATAAASAFGICRRTYLAVPVVPATASVGFHAAPAAVPFSGYSTLPMATFGYAAPAAVPFSGYSTLPMATFGYSAPPLAAFPVGGYAAVPGQYAPAQYAPPPYAPGQYAPPPYAPGQYAPPQHGLGQYAPPTQRVGMTHDDGAAAISPLLAPVIQSFLAQFLRCPPTACHGTMGGGPSEAALRDLIDARLDARLKKTEDKLDEKLDQILKEIKKGGGKTSFSATKVSPVTERNRAEMRRVLAAIEAKQVGWASQRETPVKANRPAGSRAEKVRQLLAEIEAKQSGWKRAAQVNAGTIEK